MKTDRVRRLNALIQETLSEIIRRELDIAQHAMISITDVDTAPDLSQSRIAVSIFAGDPDREQEIFKALLKQVKYLRFRLANTIEIRKTPRLELVLDDSLEKSDRLTRLIQEVN